jgi:hypothetical protein
MVFIQFYKDSATNALTGEGLNGGIDWLVDQLEYLNKSNY